MFESLRRRPRDVRIALAIAVIAIVPFLLPAVFESKKIVNGELMEYSYFNLTAFGGGIIALIHAVKTFFAARINAELTTKVKALLAVLVVVSLFQIVRGSGVVEQTTECEASYSFDLCRPE